MSKVLSRSVLPTVSAITLCASCSTVALAQATATDDGASATPASNDGLTFRVRSRGEAEPATTGLSEASSSRALQPDRRVIVTSDARPGSATLVGRNAVQLPHGGVLWATEDPDLGTPRLDISASSLVGFESGRITSPVGFVIYSNYPAFISRGEIRIYRATDVDLVAPLDTVPVEIGAVSHVSWDGNYTSSTELRAGDDLMYVLRVWGEDGEFDETHAKRLQLVTPQDAESGARAQRAAIEREQGVAIEALEAGENVLAAQVFGSNGLKYQNIPIRGSRVRIQGRDIVDGARLSINGRNHPIDLERKMVAEYLMPVGEHAIDIAMTLRDQETWSHRLVVDVSGNYFFMVGLADLTLSVNDISGSVEPLAADDRFDDDFLAEGRLAFYLRGKIQGRYLITAQADTTERELGDLFDGFFDADPRDVFRRLDPDQYYPVYGDDSTTYRDVDTQGRLYVRVDWDQNQLLFGNFGTGITGTEYAQYSRALYGLAGRIRSSETTPWGNPRSEIRAFGSRAQSAAGHSEFLGTGGSLYYLRHTDVLPGSDRVVLEVRDETTGRVENRVTLTRGVDYEIDELQGRLILTRPLSQVTRESTTTITRDTPLDGFAQILLVDYEYVPTGLNLSETTIGARGRQWIGDHIGVGGTFIEENRAGDDYSLIAGDITVQFGQGSYLKAEHSRTESTSAPVFYSDNGGLSFSEVNLGAQRREGDATAIEGRVNLRELGLTSTDWAFGAWWRDVEAGYSTARFDRAQDVQEYGVEIQSQIGSTVELYSRYSRAEYGSETLTQAQITSQYRFGDNSSVSAEVRHVDEDRTVGSGSGTLAAFRYTHSVSPTMDLYATGQMVIDSDGAYRNNDLVTVGGRYRFGTVSNVGAEFSTGDRGDAVQLNAEYEISQGHSIYGTYTYSTDRTAYDPLFNRRQNGGLTLGQRWRISRRVNLFNESQYLKTPNGNGLAHTYGMDFYPSQNWQLGFTTQMGDLERRNALGVIEQVDRLTFSLSGGYSDARTQWSSKLEWREDTGAEQREQWVTTNYFTHRVNEGLRLALRANYSETDDALNPQAGARFAEINTGFALRPWNSTRWALFGKYTFLYDVSALSQVGDGRAFFDQRSHVFSLEGVYNPRPNWEFAGHFARRDGDVRFGRLEGQWIDSGTTFAAGQVRYGLRKRWHALAEYRLLSVDDGGMRYGALVAVEREIGDNFRIGVGYNFTDFSDDLTDFNYDHQGFFINFSGRL